MSEAKPKNKVISTSSVKRLLKDVKNIIKNPLTDHGIYYIHDEDNMYCGTALIIGPSDTPYENGFYFFSFKFPKDYPFRPPRVTYSTNDGSTRFNPNLYRNGKVCVSILNTWKGEQWTSCQSIRSILLTLVTLLNNNPLTNEPGFPATHRSCKPYKRIIEYMNFKTAILGMITQKNLPNTFLAYFPILKNETLKRRESILNKINELDINNDQTEDYVSVYNMTVKYNYSELKDLLNIAIANLENI